jgi:hypothetical protein
MGGAGSDAAVRPVAEPGGAPVDASPAGRARELWPVAAIAVAFVVIGLVLGAVTSGLHPKRSERAGPATPFVAGHGATDGFDRADAGALGRPATGSRWHAARGIWGVRDGEAFVVEPATSGPSLALTVTGSRTESVQARMPVVVPGSGLAFRCQGPANCWRVEAVPRDGTWNVVKVLGGHEQVVANLGTVPVAPGTTIRVDLDGPTLRFWVNGQHARTVADAALAGSPRAGLSIRSGPAVRRARWDDFQATVTAATR